MKRSAIIDGQRRYLLTRTWDKDLPRFAAIMANPSIADGKRDDLSVIKLIGFGTRLGFGGYQLANLDSFIATNPDCVPIEDDPENLKFLRYVLLSNPVTIIAWGDCLPWHKYHKTKHRNTTVIKSFWQLAEECKAFERLFCFGITKSGNPRHVSRIAYSTPLVRWHV